MDRSSHPEYRTRGWESCKWRYSVLVGTAMVEGSGTGTISAWSSLVLYRYFPNLNPRSLCPSPDVQFSILTLITYQTPAVWEASI